MILPLQGENKPLAMMAPNSEDEQFVFQAVYDETKCRRLYCYFSEINTWARLNATIKSKIGAVMTKPVYGIEYKEPDDNSWIVLSANDLEVMDLLHRSQKLDDRQYRQGLDILHRFRLRRACYKFLIFGLLQNLWQF
jgi:hypothetical protein